MFYSIKDNFTTLQTLIFEKSQEQNEYIFDSFLLRDIYLAINNKIEINITKFGITNSNNKTVIITNAKLSLEDTPILIMDILEISKIKQENLIPDVLFVPIVYTINEKHGDSHQKYYISFEKESTEKMVRLIFPEAYTTETIYNDQNK